MDEFNKEIGEKINKYRKALNMSTTTLSKLSGTSQSSISKIENGRSTPDIKTLVNICKALGLTLYEILPDSISSDFTEDNGYRTQLSTVLNKMSDSEIQTILTLLTTNLIPVLSNLMPMIVAIEELADNERELLKKLFHSISNNQ